MASRSSGKAILLCFSTIIWTACVLAENDAAPVTVVSVLHKPLSNQIRLNANVEARRHSVLSAEVAGLVSKLMVDNGDRVATGDSLLKLRDQPTRLALAFQQAGKQRAEAGVRLAGLKEKRQGELLQSKMVAQDTYDITEAELRSASADVAATEANVALAEDELQRHVIRAPFAGVISRKQTEVGSWVSPGDPLLTLDELAVVRISAPLPQRYFNLVRVGADVTLKFPALLGELIKARVARKIAVANTASRTFPLLIDVPNEGGYLAPGMSVDVLVQLKGSDREVLLIPADALVRQADGTTLLWRVVTKEDMQQVESVPVTTGRSEGGLVEIVTDLVVAGDKIVEQGNERMRPGLPVRIIKQH